MKRIIQEAERQVPIRTTCATKRMQLMAKRQIRAERILEQMRLLFESGYHGYVNKLS